MARAGRLAGSSEAWQTLLSLAYWLGLGVVGWYTLSLAYARRYMQRLLAVLEAAGRGPGRCRYASRASWPLGAILGYLAVLATGAERPLPVWLLVFVATGTSGVSLLEYKVFGRRPRYQVVDTTTRYPCATGIQYAKGIMA